MKVNAFIVSHIDEISADIQKKLDESTQQGFAVTSFLGDVSSDAYIEFIAAANARTRHYTELADAAYRLRDRLGKVRKSIVTRGKGEFTEADGEILEQFFNDFYMD